MRNLKRNSRRNSKKKSKRDAKTLQKMALLLPQPGPGTNILWNRKILRHIQGYKLPTHFKIV